MASRFRRHFFVCQNSRPEGGKPSCGTRGSAAVLSAIQATLARSPALCDEVAVTGTACLGPCLSGPMVVVYPEGIWYAGVTPEDADELCREHVAQGHPVERLRYRWPVD